jgi:hypothetical protein
MTRQGDGWICGQTNGQRNRTGYDMESDRHDDVQLSSIRDEGWYHEEYYCAGYGSALNLEGDPIYI